MAEECNPLGALTPKQREVLNLLVQFKTSKEIAIVLGISPHTVDQRIQFAKRALGANSRSDLAQRYHTAVQIYDRMTYEESAIPDHIEAEQLTQTDDASNVMPPLIAKGMGEDEAKPAGRVVPELFESRYGILFRLGAIAMTAFLLVMVALGGIAIFNVVSEMMAA